MGAFGLTVLVFLNLLSFVPVLKLHHYRNYVRFSPLRHTVNAVFLWASLMTLKYIVGDVFPVFGYYLHLLAYIAVFWVVMNIYNTIMVFIQRPVPFVLRVAGYAYLALFSVIVLLSDVFQVIVSSHSSEMENLQDILNLEVTTLFLIHAFIAYLLLISPVIALLLYLKRERKTQLYRVPFVFFLGGLIFGLVSNVVHLFVYTFYIDPTFVVIVLFSYLLYHLIYHRDMGFILMSESRKTLIDNMREMYVVADDHGQVIDCSDELRERFDIDKTDHVDALMDKLNEKAVLYEDLSTLVHKGANKPYLYTIRNTFQLEKTDRKGELLLFYDETKFVKLLKKLEYLQSHDEMTGLYNRNYFERHVKSWQEDYENAAIVIADVNGLKLFNDHFGHKAGDELLLRFADILKGLVKGRKDIHLVRSGGDEFIVFIGSGDEKTAQNLKNAILNKTYSDDPLRQISTSVGYAVRREDENLETTLLRADNALYKMKKDTSKAYKKAFLDAYENRHDK